MRPKSANHKRSRDLTYPVSVPKEATQLHQSQSRLVQSRNSNPDHNWQFKSDKVKFSDPKSIRLIHAYQPKKLKQCLVSNPQALKKFYDSEGSCTLSKLSNNSFIKYFKEWRRNMRGKLMNIITMVLETEDLSQQIFDKIKQILLELKSIAKQMIQSSHAILQSKNCPNQTEMVAIYESFQSLKNYIINLAEILQYLEEYMKQINLLLNQGAQSQAYLEPLKKKIRKRQRQCQKKIKQFIQFCHCHPQSSMMSHAEFKLKLKFDKISNNALEGLDTITKKRQIRQAFLKKIKYLMDKDLDIENCSVEVLQEIATIFLDNDKNIRHHRQNIQYQNQVEKIIAKIQADIIRAEEEFLINFKYRSILLLKGQLASIEQTTLVNSIGNTTTNIWKQSKKKLLFLSKIYSKQRDPKYYQHLSSCIKDSSEAYRDAQQIIQVLRKLQKDRNRQSRLEVYKILKNLVEYVDSFEQNKGIICYQLKQLIGTISGNNLERMKTESKANTQSYKVKRLLFLLEYSENQTSNYLKVDNLEIEENDPEIIQQKIRKYTKNNLIQIQTFHQGQIKQLLDYSYQLKMLTKEPLIEKVLIFQDDLNRQALHSFQIIKNFNQSLLSHRKKLKQTKSDLKVGQLQKISQLYSEIVQLAAQYKNSIQLRRYLEYMQQIHIISLILRKTKLTNRITKQKYNNVYPFSNSGCQFKQEIMKNKYSFFTRHQIRSCVNSQYALLQTVLTSNEQLLQTGSPFNAYLINKTKEMECFLHRWKRYYQFKKSQWDESLYLGPKGVQNFVRYEFLRWITRSENKKQEKNQIFFINIRNTLKENVNMHIKMLERLQYQQAKMYNFDTPFLDEIQNKILQLKSHILTILPPNTCEYQTIINNCLKYMRLSEFKHIGICSNDDNPITLLLDGDQNNFNSISEHLEKLVGLPKSSIQGQIFPKVEIRDIFKSLMKIANAHKKNNRNLKPPQLQNIQQITGNKNGKKVTIQGFILDPQQDYDQIIDDDILQITEQYHPKDELKEEINQLIESGQIKSSLGKLNKSNGIQDFRSEILNQQLEEEIQQMPQQISDEPQFILSQRKIPIKQDEIAEPPGFLFDLLKVKRVQTADKNKQKIPEKPESSQQQSLDEAEQQIYLNPLRNSFNSESMFRIPQQLIMISKRPFTYYKFTKIQDLTMLKNCLKFADNEHSLIKSSLKIQVLCKLYDNNYVANEEVVAHLDDALAKLSEKSLISIFNQNNKYTKSQKTIADLRDWLKNNQSATKAERQLKAKPLFDFLRVTCMPIYEGRKGDQLMVFNIEQSHYCHINLNDEYPFILSSDQTNVLTPQSMLSLQTYFLSQLLAGFKNKHFDKIQQLVSKINEQLLETYSDLKQRLDIYRQYMLDNGKEVDERVMDYYQRVTKSEVKLTPVYGNNNSDKGVSQYHRNLKDIMTIMEFITGCTESKEKITTIKVMGSTNFPYTSPFLVVSSPKIVLQSLSSPLLSLPSQFLVEESSNLYLNRESFTEYVLNLKKYQQDHVKIVTKKITPLKIQSIFQILYGNTNDPRGLRKDKIFQELKNRNNLLGNYEDNLDYQNFMKIEKVLFPNNPKTLKFHIQKMVAEKQLTEKLIINATNNSSFLLEQPNDKTLDSDNSGFEDMNKGIFILENKKILSEQPNSQILQEISQLFQSANVEHTKILDKNGNFIGLVEQRIKLQNMEEEVDKYMNIVRPIPFQILTDQTLSKGIVIIPRLLIYIQPLSTEALKNQKPELLSQFLEDNDNTLEILSISNKKKQAQSKPKSIYRAKLTLQNIYNQIPLQCEYPRPKLMGRLIKDRNQAVWLGNLLNYQYGQKFLLKTVQNLIVQHYEQFKIKKQQEETQRLQFKQEGLRYLKEEEILKQKQRIKQQNLQAEKQAKIEAEKRKGSEDLSSVDLPFLLPGMSQKSQKQDHILQVKSVVSQGAVPKRITVPQIINKMKNRKKSTHSTDSDDNLSQISIILSERGDYDRKNLIECKMYKFEEVQKLIRQKK